MKKGIKFLFSLIVSAGLLIYFFRDTSLTEIINDLKRVSLFFFLCFAAISLLATVLRTWRFHLLISGQISFGKLFLITLVQNFAVDLLPARSAAIFFYSYFTNREGLKLSWGLGSYALTILLDTLLMMIILLLLLPFLPLMQFASARLTMLLVVILFLVLAIIVWLEALLFIPRRLAEKFKLRKVAHFFEELQNYSRQLTIVQKFRLLLLSFLIRALKYFSLFLLFSVLSGAPWTLKSFAVMTLAVAAAELSALLPVQGLAGFGTWEGAFKIVVDLLSLPIANPFQIAFILHLLTQLWEYSLGVTVLTILLFNRKKPQSG